MTIDTDWAPDWMLEYVIDLFIKNKIKSTWFITNQSKCLKTLRENRDYFELGIHPNFSNGSSHGDSIDKVLKHCKNLVPEAVSMRTHGLFQSTNILVKANIDYGIMVDTSLFLSGVKEIMPFKFKFFGSNLLRVPYSWEDDHEMCELKPVWKFKKQKLKQRSMYIYNFHPVHIFLNSKNFSRYEKLKLEIPLQNWDYEFMKNRVFKGRGTKNFFKELISSISGTNIFIRDLLSEY